MVDGNSATYVERKHMCKDKYKYRARILYLNFNHTNKTLLMNYFRSKD